MIKIKNTETGEVLNLTLIQVLKEINRDRSENFQDYNETDWKEGLQVMTEFELLEGKND